ncbi:hypothetical protein, partial [Helicobacter sp. CLO-3]|uniref:hypothetical protein n=1 Tax=Helicobacter sp. CLO-3 TaxID=211 RepID=UPI001C40B44F
KEIKEEVERFFFKEENAKGVPLPPAGSGVFLKDNTLNGLYPTPFHPKQKTPYKSILNFLGKKL